MNKFLNLYKFLISTKHPVDIKMYNKQRNYVAGLNKQAKFKYFNNLNCKKYAFLG